MRTSFLYKWVRLYQRLRKDDLSGMSAQITYYLLFAIVPFLIVFLNIIKYSPLSTQDILVYVYRIMPSQAADLVMDNVDEVMNSGTVTSLSLGILIAIWSASKGTNALIHGINKAYDVEEDRSFVFVRILSIIVTIGIPFVIIVLFLFLVLGETISDYVLARLYVPDMIMTLWTSMRYIFPIFLMGVFFTLFYRVVPNRRLKFKEVIPGAIFTTLGWVAISLGFSYYVNHFADYSRIYGSLGSIIILMLWLYMSSGAIVIGGEINATFSESLNREN